MATAVLFIGWDKPIPTREQKAWSYLLGEGSEFLGKLQSEGWCERYDRVGLTPHGGDLNGFILLHGERAKLDELRRTDSFERFSMQMGQLFQSYGVLPGITGAGIDAVVKRNPDWFKKQP